MKSFSAEFRSLFSIIERHQSFLLFAHNGPDSDTIGSVLALANYIESTGKSVTCACFDEFPSYLKSFKSHNFVHPSSLRLNDFDCIIAADSVERGFHLIHPEIGSSQTVVLIDHHPHISIKGNLTIIDPEYSSACELIYMFFRENHIPINRVIATDLLMGILWDTGNFQHSITTAEVMNIGSDLVKRGAPLRKIVDAIFLNKKMSTLKLWGKAFENATIIPETGMIVTVLTKKDITDCGADADDIAQVASFLNTVPGTKFSLILSERGNSTIKGSLRSDEYKGVDVSLIARQLGGGGHRLASGFELKGDIIETADGCLIT